MNYSEVTEYIKDLADLSCQNNNIRPEMYGNYNVKRGLRDENGFGVIVRGKKFRDLRRNIREKSVICMEMEE